MGVYTNSATEHERNRNRETNRQRALNIVTRIKEAGRDLLAYGYYESYENTIYLSGACNVGKSTLANQFIGVEIPMEWISTDGLEIHFGQNGIDLDLRKMVPIKEGELSVLSKITLGKVEVDKGALGHESGEAPLPDNHHEQPSTKGSSAGNTEQQFYKLTDEFLNTVRKGQYRMKVAPSDLVDFGGQRSYDLTHQLFIRRKGTFVVMFDGRYGFSMPLPEYPGLQMTNEDIVKHWVYSILTYCVEGPGLLPMILFAATHSDYFTKDEIEGKKVEYLATLKGYFNDHNQKDHIVLDTVFFINARNKDDRETRRLQDRLVSIAFQQPDWGQRRPVRWVPLEMQIMEMRKNENFIVEKSQLQRINESNGDLSLTKEQLDEFLKYQHSAGKIVYYDQPGLNNFVVLYPPALVNILRAFITDERFWPTSSVFDKLKFLFKGKNIRKSLENLQETCKISKHDLLAIWNQPRSSIKDANTADYVIQLLVFLDVLIVPRQYRNLDTRATVVANEFLVPCVVKQNLPPSFMANESFHERTIALVFALKNSNVPSALAYKLIGAVASIWPIKQEGDRVHLYQFAAVLNVDCENEMVIYVKDNRVVVYLTNRVTKIQHDVAASIQECLVNALNYTLHFYNRSMGGTEDSFRATDLYDIYIGEVCNKDPCVIKVEEAKEKSEWDCCHGCHHETAQALGWVFEMHSTRCPSTCKGVSSFRDLMISLGLQAVDLDNLEFEYRKPLLLMFMGLKKWRDNMTMPGKEPCIRDVQLALAAIGNNEHHLCQAFKRGPDFEGMMNFKGISSTTRQHIPDDKVLMDLAHNMGNCTVHLGIELGVTLASIEETLYRYPKDLFQQTFDIMRKWRKQSSSSQPTILRLMQVVDRVDKGGLRFLMEHYKA